MSVRAYIDTNKDRFLDELFSLIRIPSISAKPENKPEMIRCAERWKELLLQSGADHAEVMSTPGNPVVYAEKKISPEAPTVLVYGHYDVMPAEPLELWNSEPFEPVVKEGRIWARGADDDKGQSMMQVKGFEIAVREGLLHCNVKFILEGEEEIGSESLGDFVKTHHDLLRADVILVSDTSMVSDATPSLTTGLRGLSYWEMEVDGPSRDLHSGHFGGAVANPVNMLCKMIAGLTDSDGRITLPGFYDDVDEVSEEERDMIAQIPFDEKKYKTAIGVKELFGEKGYTTLERNSIRPSFDVCGIWGGYIGEGSKTVLPSKAFAKFSCRLVPHQNHEKIGKNLAGEFLRTFTDDDQFTKEVTSLVRWHMQILFVVNDLPFSDIEEMKHEVDIHEIGLLGLCDRLGRLHADKEKEEQNMRLFLKKCNET